MDPFLSINAGVGGAVCLLLRNSTTSGLHKDNRGGDDKVYTIHQDKHICIYCMYILYRNHKDRTENKWHMISHLHGP